MKDNQIKKIREVGINAKQAGERLRLALSQFGRALNNVLQMDKK